MCSLRRSFLTVLVLLFLPIPIAILNAWFNSNTPAWSPMQLAEGEISLEYLLEWEGDYILVDARSPEAYEAAHIPDAVNLYAGEFEDQILGFLDVWSPESKVVVYCDSRQCDASAEIAARLKEDFQMEHVFVLKGGWESWTKAAPHVRSELGGEG